MKITVLLNFMLNKSISSSCNFGIKRKPCLARLSDDVPRRRLELPHLAAYAPQAYLYTIPTPGRTGLGVYFLITIRNNT